jgi:hypothetical protein
VAFFINICCSLVLLAPTEGKILLRENLFFVVDKERPQEVPFATNKKRLAEQKIGMMAGNCSKKMLFLP